MYETALNKDYAIARLYRHNGAMNMSVKLEPGTTTWNQTCCKDYMWSMLNCNGEFLGKDCSSAKMATVMFRRGTSKRETLSRTYLLAELIICIVQNNLYTGNDEVRMRE